MKKLKFIKNIIFDCDGVLYSDLEAVFGQVSRRMTKFISENLNIDKNAAKKLQTDYFYKYNTSLNGLMIHNSIEPNSFLEYVHDIDLSFLKKDVVLRKELENLDVKKFVFTNGSTQHVKNITNALGIADMFLDIHDIEDSKYHPKPDAKAFDLMIDKFDIEPSETLYIEDIAKNLSIGKKRGTLTCWLENTEHFGMIDSDKGFIDYKIKNLSSFLKQIRVIKSS